MNRANHVGLLAVVVTSCLTGLTGCFGDGPDRPRSDGIAPDPLSSSDVADSGSAPWRPDAGPAYSYHDAGPGYAYRDAGPSRYDAGRPSAPDSGAPAPAPFVASCDESDSSGCISWRYTMTIPSARDASIYDACRRNWDRSVACGDPHDADFLCDRFARVERAATIPAYDCFAAARASTCTPDPATDCGEVPDEAFADEIMASFVYDAALHSFFAKEGWWLRDEIKDVARTCLREDARGHSSAACVGAWMQMVAPL